MLSKLTRRQLLATFLGAPAALALQGCPRQATGPLPPGQLVGTSVSFGHRLRQAPPTPPADRWQQTQVLIVGGGIAGLSAARRLMQAGIEDFLLLELEPAVGGTSRSGRDGSLAFPWGAHYVPAPMANNRPLINLLNELQVFEGVDQHGDPIVAEQHVCRDPQERVFYKGTWYEGLYLRAGASDDDLRQLQRFENLINQWVDWRDSQGRRAFILPLAHGSDDAEVTQLDRITMAQWLDQQQLDSWRLRWLVDYSCRDDYGMTAEQTSAWAGIFYFASRARSSAEPSRPFITWPEGNGRIVAHLYRQVKRHCLVGLAVADINPTTVDGQPTIEVAALERDGRGVRGFRARHVIFAAPHFLARYLIRPYRQDPPPYIDQFEYGAWMVANLSLRDRPSSRGFALSWDNVLYESPSLGYVTATHQRGLDYGPTVLTYYFPLCDDNPNAGRQRLLDTGRDEWAEIALADLQRGHPDIRALTERIDVMRWGHAMIRPRPGFIWGAARRAATQPWRGIHFAHCDLSGLPLIEEAFYRGTHAAEQILQETRGGIKG